MPQNVFPPNACVYCTGNPDPIRRRNAPASRSESESWLFPFCKTTLPMIKRSCMARQQRLDVYTQI